MQREAIENKSRIRKIDKLQKFIKSTIKIKTKKTEKIERAVK